MSERDELLHVNWKTVGDSRIPLVTSGRSTYVVLNLAAKEHQITPAALLQAVARHPAIYKPLTMTIYDGARVLRDQTLVRRRHIFPLLFAARTRKISPGHWLALHNALALSGLSTTPEAFMNEEFSRAGVIAENEAQVGTNERQATEITRLKNQLEGLQNRLAREKVPKKNKRNSLSVPDLIHIHDAILTGTPSAELEKKYNVGPTIIKAAAAGRYWSRAGVLAKAQLVERGGIGYKPPARPAKQAVLP